MALSETGRATLSFFSWHPNASPILLPEFGASSLVSFSQTNASGSERAQLFHPASSTRPLNSTKRVSAS
jgi:hypothetical protein